MRWLWSLWKTNAIIPFTLTMYVSRAKQQKPQPWQKHWPKGTNPIPIAKILAILEATGDFFSTTCSPNSESRWAVDGTNTEIGYGNNLHANVLNLFLNIKGFSDNTVDNFFVLRCMRMSVDIWYIESQGKGLIAGEIENASLHISDSYVHVPPYPYRESFQHPLAMARWATCA